MRPLGFAVLLLATLALPLPSSSDPGAPGGRASGWPFAGGDAGGLRYSPLASIDRTNVRALERVWSVRTGDLAADPPPPDHMAFQATPIVAGGLLLLPTPLGRVLALDPGTGAERWRFDATVVGHEFPEYASRGVASWVDPLRAPAEPCARRVFAATVDSRLFALDLATGRRCADFGRDGRVDLREGIGELHPWDYATSSPPVVAGELVIVGSAIADNRRVDAPPGVLRAYDARSGALRWSWDPIPRGAEDPAYAGWDPEAARRTGAANAWAPLSVDAERDLLFVPTSSPSPDYFGGLRPGEDRHANSVVALRASTGALVWSRQLVHHDLWDYDVPAQPTLASVRRDGAEIPVVIQATKMGHLFVLHRETGEPVFPIEERPVPASDVPGEVAAPTQPFPLVPAPFVPQRLRAEDAWGLTPWDRGRCRRRIERLRNEGIFTPPSLRGTLVYPAHTGGANWGGVAIDPERRVLVVNATNLAFEVRLIPRDGFESERASGQALLREFGPQQGAPFGMVREPLLSPFLLPCNPPPWGTLTALSLDDGALLWQRPLGTLPDRIPIRLPIEMGLPNLGGPLATAGGLVFVAAAMDGVLRAFDVATGEELWSDRLPAGGNATPMSFLGPDGRQVVALAAGGHGKLGTRRGDHVLAWALPPP